MSVYKTFGEFVEHRGALRPRPKPEAGVEGEMAPLQPSVAAGADPFTERSAFRNPFKGLFKVVNPARPASPTNSRLLASPFRKKLKGQVMGR